MKPHRVNLEELGHAHALTFSCYRRYPFLKAERTCRWLAEAIEQARDDLQFCLWAYVFMPDHVHLIIRPRSEEHEISDIRKAIKSPVAEKAIAHIKSRSPEWLPRITRKRGNKTERLFWQSGGGYDRNVVEPGTLMQMIDYVHNNPVRAGFVIRAGEWRWSSAAWYADQSPIPIAVDPIPWEWLH